VYRHCVKPGLFLGLLLIGALACLPAGAARAQGRGGPERYERRMHDGERERERERIRPRRERREWRWRWDDRFHHAHYYPRIGYRIRVLPRRYVVVEYRGGPFYFWSGIWYRPLGAGYVVVEAPIGAVVPVLPDGCTIVWIGGVAYCYANDVYYVPATPGPGYTVVAPPPGAESASTQPPPGAPAAPFPPAAAAAGGTANASPPAGRGPVVTPRNGQSEAQLFSDRAACAQWATDQSGVDPAKAGAHDAQSQEALKAYRRAERSCLEDRGYTVQ
jgi:Family of unknown function (DUF6515)